MKLSRKKYTDSKPLDVIGEDMNKYSVKQGFTQMKSRPTLSWKVEILPEEYQEKVLRQYDYLGNSKFARYRLRKLLEEIFHLEDDEWLTWEIQCDRMQVRIFAPTVLKKDGE